MPLLHEYRWKPVLSVSLLVTFIFQVLMCSRLLIILQNIYRNLSALCCNIASFLYFIIEWTTCLCCFKCCTFRSLLQFVYQWYLSWSILLCNAKQYWLCFGSWCVLLDLYEHPSHIFKIDSELLNGVLHRRMYSVLVLFPAPRSGRMLCAQDRRYTRHSGILSVAVSSLYVAHTFQ
jgi:hypothetical protein